MPDQPDKKDTYVVDVTLKIPCILTLEVPASSEKAARAEALLMAQNADPQDWFSSLGEYINDAGVETGCVEIEVIEKRPAGE